MQYWRWLAAGLLVGLLTLVQFSQREPFLSGVRRRLKTWDEYVNDPKHHPNRNAQPKNFHNISSMEHFVNHDAKIASFNGVNEYRHSDWTPAPTLIPTWDGRSPTAAPTAEPTHTPAPSQNPTPVPTFPPTIPKSIQVLTDSHQHKSFLKAYEKSLAHMSNHHGGGLDNRGLKGAGKALITALLHDIRKLPESECEACCVFGALTPAEQAKHQYREICTDVFRVTNFDPCGLVQQFSCVPKCKPHAGFQLAKHMCSCIKDECKSNVFHVHRPPVGHHVVDVPNETDVGNYHFGLRGNSSKLPNGGCPHGQAPTADRRSKADCSPCGDTGQSPCAFGWEPVVEFGKFTKDGCKPHKGLWVDDGKCQTCGWSSKLPCKKGHFNPLKKYDAHGCEEGLALHPKRGRCVYCGGQGDIPCMNGCKPHHVLNKREDHCIHCGYAHQPPCDCKSTVCTNGKPQPCALGLAPNYQEGECVHCGSRGQLPCAEGRGDRKKHYDSDGCEPHYALMYGFCIHCGASGEPACQDGCAGNRPIHTITRKCM